MRHDKIQTRPQTLAMIHDTSWLIELFIVIQTHYAKLSFFYPLAYFG